MQLILVTGGARSGKSDYARSRALERGGADVTYVATARPGDPEMERRITRHRAERPAGWRTVEAALDVATAIREAETDVVVLDCFTLLASNTLEAGAPSNDDEAARMVIDLVEELHRTALARRGTLFVVTNEVGCGVVPQTSLGRWFRDALGAGNRRLASLATEVVLLVAGLPVMVKPERVR